MQSIFDHNEFSAGVVFVLVGVSKDGVGTAIFYPECKPVNVSENQSHSLVAAVHHPLYLSLLPKFGRAFYPFSRVYLSDLNWLERLLWA